MSSREDDGGARSAVMPESSRVNEDDGGASIAAEWASTTEVTTGGSGRWPSRLASSRLAERISAIGDLRARRIATLTLLIAFVLVVLAQWKPWFQVAGTGVDFGNADRPAPSVDAINALNLLAIPYYLGWMLIAMAGGAAVLGRKRIRRTAAGVAAGGLAGQALVVLATWHDDGIGLYSGLASPTSTLHSQRQSGIYLAVAALVVTAAALVIAVRGRIIPTADDDEDAATLAPAAAYEPYEPGPRKGVRAGTPWVAGGEDLDDELTGRHGRLEPAPSNRPQPVENGHQAVERSGGTTPVAPRSEATDHSLYMRPQDAKVNY